MTDSNKGDTSFIKIIIYLVLFGCGVGKIAQGIFYDPPDMLTANTSIIVGILLFILMFCISKSNIGLFEKL